MVVPSLRRRTGAMEIKNKLIKEREEKRKKAESEKRENISDEEHRMRMEKLKEIGLIKNE